MKLFKINTGFTLIEVLIYTALTAVVGILMTGILLSVSQVHQRESASTEVTGQLNFVTQTIGRLVRTASNIEIDAGVSASTIKLRMQDSTKDPTCISLVDGVIKLAEGPGTNPNDCSATTSDLTNTRVIVNALNFKKFVQYPGHDTVSYDVQMTYNSQNPKAQVQRSLSSAIARVSAATFDSSILPGSADFEIGQTGSAWKNLYLSGVLNLGTSVTDPVIAQNGSIYYNTASSTFRGYKAGVWGNIGGDLWTASSTAIYYNTGNVGIGTTTPAAKLEIAGLVYQSGLGQSTYFGYEAGKVDDLTDNRNTGVGYQALYSNTTGNNNSAMGFQALYSNTSGTFNSAMGGFRALYSNTTGWHNSAMGAGALLYNTTGFRNSAMGVEALQDNTEGVYNSAMGNYALQRNTTGNYNSAMGVSAGVYIADGSTANQTSNNSLYLGYGTRALADGGTNEIVIGAGAIGVGNNSVVLGNDSIVKTALKGNVGIGTTGPTNVTANADLTITGTIAQDSWTDPTLLNGWANYGGGYNPAGYFRDKNGIVHLSGLLSGTGATAITVFALPAGYRPANRELLYSQAYTGAAYAGARVDVDTAGNVIYTNPGTLGAGWLSLDGITFRASGY